MAVKNVAQVVMKIKHGSAADWATKNPILAAGELGAEINTGLIKLGDGVHNYNDLNYINAPTSTGLKRAIVDELPSPENADENTIYLIRDSEAVGPDYYKEYLLINGIFAQIGDTSVDLTGVLRTPLNYHEGDLLAFGADGSVVDFDINNIHTSTNVNDLTQDDGDELILYCGTATTVI